MDTNNGPGRPQKPNMRRRHVSIPEDLHDRVAKDADDDRRDFSSMLTIILEQHYEGADAPAAG